MTASAKVEKGMGEVPLPPIEPNDDIRHIVGAGLDKVEPDPEIKARFYAPEAVAARAERDAQRRTEDWAALSRYRQANKSVSNPDTVFIGDSLTEIWSLAIPEMFDEKTINRGISGQTSPQILLRFMADVVDLKPRRVHILCGGNDIAGNTGPNLPEDYKRNIRAMADIAEANGIKVMLASITPATEIFWQPESDPLKWGPALTVWLRDFASERGFTFVDYHSALTNEHGGLQDRYSADGVHVTRLAYQEMRAIFEAALL